MIPEVKTWHIKLFILRLWTYLQEARIGSRWSRAWLGRRWGWEFVCLRVNFKAIDLTSWQQILLAERHWKWCNKPSDVPSPRSLSITLSPDSINKVPEAVRSKLKTCVDILSENHSHILPLERGSSQVMFQIIVVADILTSKYTISLKKKNHGGGVVIWW